MAYDFPDIPTLGQVFKNYTWDGEKWQQTSRAGEISALVVVFDGGGLALTPGMKGYLQLPFTCNLEQADLIADRLGSIIVDVWKCSFAQFDAGATHPVDADSITSLTPPTLAVATKYTDSSLVSWTTAIAAGDVLAFNIDSASLVRRVTLTITYMR